MKEFTSIYFVEHLKCLVAEPGAVEDLEAIEDDHRILVTWSLPNGSDTCPTLQYRARYFIDSTLIHMEDTQDLEVTFDVTTPSCHTINITVVLVYNGEEFLSASTDVVASKFLFATASI